MRMAAEGIGRVAKRKHRRLAVRRRTAGAARPRAPCRRCHRNTRRNRRSRRRGVASNRSVPQGAVPRRGWSHARKTAPLQCMIALAFGSTPHEPPSWKGYPGWTSACLIGEDVASQLTTCVLRELRRLSRTSRGTSPRNMPRHCRSDTLQCRDAQVRTSYD
jgi:hypothetical protein